MCASDLTVNHWSIRKIEKQGCGGRGGVLEMTGEVPPNLSILWNCAPRPSVVCPKDHLDIVPDQTKELGLKELHCWGRECHGGEVEP